MFYEFYVVVEGCVLYVLCLFFVLLGLKMKDYCYVGCVFYFCFVVYGDDGDYVVIVGLGGVVVGILCVIDDGCGGVCIVLYVFCGW